jgi:hypothetical protein
MALDSFFSSLDIYKSPPYLLTMNSKFISSPISQLFSFITLFYLLSLVILQL